MRRAQIDAGSQPVRNLAGNPAFAASSGTVIVRTNLCPSPNGDYTGANVTVRTNLATNPRGVNGFADYAGVGTITPNVAITGHPDGITTANRLTYAANAINPGVAFLDPLTSGTQYTASAWVYHETVGGGTQGLAQSGIASQPSPPAITQGVWTRLSWTFTASGTSKLGFRVSSNTGAGSFLVTGVLVEAAPDLVNFYDGATPAAGDFTYVWSGTANASTSIQRAVAVGGWAGAGQAVAYQSSVSPFAGTRSVAVATKGVNADGAFVADANVAAGAAYTFSSWVRVNDAPPTFYANMRYKDSSNVTVSDLTWAVTSSLVVGQWVRVSYTSVAPVGATKLQAMWRIFSTHTPTTFYIDNTLIEQHVTLLPYFDGSTAAAGEFTYNWTGAANATTSEQRAAAIPATSASKSGSNPDSKFFGYQSTAEDGKKTLKFVAPAGTPNSTWRVGSINGNSTQGWDSAKIKGGGQYTLFLRWRGSGWGAGQVVQTQIADGTGANPVIGNDGAGLVLNTTGWQEYRRTFTALRDATTNSQIYMSLPTVPQTATDGVFEVRDWMLVEGAYTGDMIDGSKPFSKWDGTANLSSSVGYPQQLLDIAGKPILDYSAAGTYLLDDSFGATEARSFYTVMENFGENTGGVSPVLKYGDLALNDTVPNTSIQLRQDNDSIANGSNNLFLRRTGAQGVNASIKTGRHVAAWGINNSGYLFMGADGNTRLTDTQVMSMLHQKFSIDPDQPLNKHIRTIMYRGLHDSTTALAVQRYLGNKYGAAVA